MCSITCNCFIKKDASLRYSKLSIYFKGVKGHGGYSSCSKCIVIGEYDLSGRHMSYTRTDCELRSHNAFIRKNDEDHHLFDPTTRGYVRTPLEDMFGIDMINSFPVADSMHLIETGTGLNLTLKVSPIFIS